MNPVRAFDDFFGLLSDLEGPAAVWEKNNLFLALSYLNKSEIPAGLEALALQQQKSIDEIKIEFQLFQDETARQQNRRKGNR